MKLYITIISIAMIIISILNIILNTAIWYYVIISVIWCTAIQFILDGIIATIIKLMPAKWFSIDNSFYKVSQKERALYIKLNVKHWKEKIWELGGVGGFSKKSIKEPNNAVYIERFIIESNKGVLIHRLCYFIGFFAMITLPNICAFSIALPVAFVNMFLNILPTIVLRYNTPTLQLILYRLKRKDSYSKKN